jgi:hypothetical protein
MKPNSQPRLMAVAKQYGIGAKGIIKILLECGFEVDDLRPTSYLTEEMLRTIDSYSKVKINVESQGKLTDRQSESINFDSTKVENIEFEKIKGPRILGKIDLPSLEDSNGKKDRVIQINKPGNYSNVEFIGLAVGKLVFFDYYKNNFGIIEDIVTEKNKKVIKARVFEEGLKIKRNLKGGEYVIFKLQYSEKFFHKYLATDVDSIANISIDQILILIDSLDSVILMRILPKLNELIFSEIAPEVQSKFWEKLIKIPDEDIWKLAVKINDDYYIQKYIATIINSYQDEIKINYLRASYSFGLLKNIIECWNSVDVNLIESIFKIAKDNNVIDGLNLTNFINSLSLSDLNYDMSWGISVHFNIDDLRDKLIHSFSFTLSGSIDKFQLLNDKFHLNAEELEGINKKIIITKDALSFATLYEIYVSLDNFKFIREYGDFVQLCNGKELGLNDLKKFIKKIPKGYLSDDVLVVIRSSINKIGRWELRDLIEELNLGSEVAFYIVDQILNKEGDLDRFELVKLIKDKSKIKSFNRFFLDKYADELASYSSFEVLQLAIDNGSVIAQEAIYKYISSSKGYSLYFEHDILIIVDNLKEIIIPEKIKAINRPFSEFIAFFSKNRDFDFSSDLKIFLTNFSGSAQTLVIKYLIFQFYKKNIPESKLFNLLQSFKWTEISALLIVEFMKEKSYTDKILTHKLDSIFKSHFMTLMNISYSREKYLLNFQIGNIVSKCNGRKYYDGTNWQNKRWYFKEGKVTVSTKRREDYSLDFFCEGRPWKIADVWNSELNKSTGEKIEFYWCKTMYCAARNDNVDKNKPYFKWTISEIADVMGISIQKLALAYLAGWANRMNKIVECLFCRECKEVLRPLPYEPHTLGYYAVPLFNCINPICSKNAIKIRFTHCLNGKCVSHVTSEPLDSRDCESCNPANPSHTGLLCKYCGQLCPSCSGGYRPVIVDQIF